MRRTAERVARDGARYGQPRIGLRQQSAEGVVRERPRALVRILTLRALAQRVVARRRDVAFGVRDRDNVALRFGPVVRRGVRLNS